MRRIASCWQVLDGVLKEHAHSVYKALRRPATEKSIRRFEELAGEKLPADLFSSLRVHDGMHGPAVLVDYMTLLPLSGIRSWWECECRVQGLGQFEGNPYVETAKIKNDVRWREGWIPVMADAGGNLMVLDLDPSEKGRRGQLFPWFNNGEGEMRVIAESFAQWLDHLAEQMLHRRFRLDETGSILLEKG